MQAKLELKAANLRWFVHLFCDRLHTAEQPRKVPQPLGYFLPVFSKTKGDTFRRELTREEHANLFSTKKEGMRRSGEGGGGACYATQNLSYRKGDGEQAIRQKTGRKRKIKWCAAVLLLPIKRAGKLEVEVANLRWLRFCGWLHSADTQYNTTIEITFIVDSRKPEGNQGTLQKHLSRAMPAGNPVKYIRSIYDVQLPVKPCPRPSPAASPPSSLYV